jgi:hypothetical protein
VVQLLQELGHVVGVFAIVFNNQYLRHALAILVTCPSLIPMVALSTPKRGPDYHC